jgi:excisionase family DNA binding protein
MATADVLSAAPRRWLTVSAAAGYSGLSEPSVRRLLATGRLTGYRPVRKRILIDKMQLDSVIETSADRQPETGAGTVPAPVGG